MEQTKVYEKKLLSLGQALDSFEKAMTIDTTRLGNIEQDTIETA